MAHTMQKYMYTSSFPAIPYRPHTAVGFARDSFHPFLCPIDITFNKMKGRKLRSNVVFIAFHRPLWDQGKSMNA